MEKDLFVPSFLFIQEMHIYLLTEMEGRGSCLRECSLRYFFFRSSLLSKSIVLAKVVHKQLLLQKTLDKMA